MDAIDNLVAGARRTQAVVDRAAQELAAADLPTTRDPDPANPVAPAPRAHDIDVADQLVTMHLAAGAHHATTAALRTALSIYNDSLDLLRPEP
jgi:hypothetical protein